METKGWSGGGCEADGGREVGGIGGGGGECQQENIRQEDYVTQEEDWRQRAGKQKQDGEEVLSIINTKFYKYI